MTTSSIPMPWNNILNILFPMMLSQNTRKMLDIAIITVYRSRVAGQTGWGGREAYCTRPETKSIHMESTHTVSRSGEMCDKC